MKHTGAEIVAQLIIDLAIGTDPPAKGPWPTFAGQMRDDSDSAITLVDNTVRTEGRIHRPDNKGKYETIYQESFQIRIRDKAYDTARTKMMEIKDALDKIVRKRLSVEDKYYQIQGIHLLMSPADLGPDLNHRMSFSLNYTAKVSEV